MHFNYPIAYVVSLSDIIGSASNRLPLHCEDFSIHAYIEYVSYFAFIPIVNRTTALPLFFSPSFHFQSTFYAIFSITITFSATKMFCFVFFFSFLKNGALFSNIFTRQEYRKKKTEVFFCPQR